MCKPIVVAFLILSASGILNGKQAEKYYKVSSLGPGTVGIYCTNGADATLVRTPQFGLIVVSCGTREDDGLGAK